MAVKWAVANGNWNAGATWNGGVVPVDGDYVYANGYTIALNVAVSQSNTVISNGLCQNTQRSGGVFTINIGTQYSVFSIFLKKIECENSYILSTTNAYESTLNIIADIDITNSAYAIRCNGLSYRYLLTINGNVTTNSDVIYAIGSNFRCAFTINGNIRNTNAQPIYIFNHIGNEILFFVGNGNFDGGVKICSGHCRQVQYVGNQLFIDANQLIDDANILSELVIDGNAEITDATITGDIIASGYVLSGTTLNISGSITYKSTNNTVGVRYTTMNILNPDTFTWKDVTTPRSNPFIILTDAEMNNRQQYPAENEVKEGVEYVWGEKIGTYQAPPESVVLKGYVYDNGDKIGSLENQTNVGCVTKEDVREGVSLLGMGEVGTLVVPSVDDVREGVVFDNGSVGTLIVEGGGDRLRIADFGYYTNAQSDTYIVDLTEQDKPKFAVAEERVLIEMFPDLDLDNIPEKYFDDLFVKHLKYRLIVEYYRTAGINSTFTPSEPTTEIVNYRNVNCEIWMNIANTYLKAWGTKYPNSIKKQRILL